MRSDDMDRASIHARPGLVEHWKPRIAVLLPCHNEALTIGAVVSDFRRSLPSARIYVYDNRSTDGTEQVATTAGAIVRRETTLGKGNVVRRMFADIDADVYVLADGDDTYDARSAARHVDMLVDEELDLVNIARVPETDTAYPPGHQFGNRALTYLVHFFFGGQVSDLLSGYKILSRRFVKSFPAMSRGFETETELAVHALELRMAIREVKAPFRNRPEGSLSKLRTYRDGVRILTLITRLVKEERPLPFFGGAGLALILIAAILGFPVIVHFFETGLVPRLPTAVLSTGLVVVGFLSIFAGLILDTVTRARQEMKRLSYLAIPRMRDEEWPADRS